MGRDSNRRSEGKVPSLRQRLEDVEQSYVWHARAIRQLLEAFMVEEEPLRRAKILAILRAMESSGDGAR